MKSVYRELSKEESYKLLKAISSFIKSISP